MPPTKTTWRVVIQQDVGNLYLLERKLDAINGANPVHEPAGGTWRTITLTVTCDPESTAADAGARGLALLASALGDTPDARIISATPEESSDT